MISMHRHSVPPLGANSIKNIPVQITISLASGEVTLQVGILSEVEPIMGRVDSKRFVKSLVRATQRPIPLSAQIHKT